MPYNKVVMSGFLESFPTPAAGVALSRRVAGAAHHNPAVGIQKENGMYVVGKAVRVVRHERYVWFGVDPQWELCKSTELIQYRAWSRLTGIKLSSGDRTMIECREVAQ